MLHAMSEGISVTSSACLTAEFICTSPVWRRMLRCVPRDINFGDDAHWLGVSIGMRLPCLHKHDILLTNRGIHITFLWAYELTGTGLKAADKVIHYM